ncbi:Gfo/Idh/MocA family protein [Nocardiopsis sp. RV163]|uniref:Gfo/Idh/MocA family protein n=1 Tax=Nocardiopsis sp. RV163 TaxID=1661388 RepID=UPI00064BF494|nr:Gfo/Idh/MocA family oxidoreductase [Nocardiopsis sp. RV163]
MSAHPVPRVAVVGTGWMARRVWLPMLAAHAGARVTAVVEPVAERRGAALAACPGALPIKSEELDRSVADAVVVAVPNDQHAAVAAPLLRRGMDVFVEKPVCLSSGEADTLASASAMGGGRLLAWSPARHRADVAALASLRADLGPVRYAELEWVRAAGVPSHADWYRDGSRSGGGALVDLGWHLLDVGLDLLGGPGVLRACGVVSADFVDRDDRAASWHAGAPTSTAGARGVEDSAYGFVTTTDGTGISLRSSWASHNARDLTRLALHGARGSATLETTFGFSPHRTRPALTVRVAGRERGVDLPHQEVGAEYRAQVEALVAAVAAPGRTGDALDRTRGILAAIEGIYDTSGDFVHV